MKWKRKSSKGSFNFSNRSFLTTNRAKKFGIEDAPQLADVKKKSRAERFGLVNEPVQNGKNGASENSEESEELDSKKKSRAERFGLNINQKRVINILRKKRGRIV